MICYAWMDKGGGRKCVYIYILVMWCEWLMSKMGIWSCQKTATMGTTYNRFVGKKVFGGKRDNMYPAAHF